MEPNKCTFCKFFTTHYRGEIREYKCFLTEEALAKGSERCDKFVL